MKFTQPVPPASASKYSYLIGSIVYFEALLLRMKLFHNAIPSSSLDGLCYVIHKDESIVADAYA
jgi:hypothetical protein